MSKVLDKMTELRDKGEPLVLVTVVEAKGDGPAEVGKKMIVGESGIALGTVGGGALEYNAIAECKKLFVSRTSYMEKYLLNEGKMIENTKTLPMVCGGVVTLFYEYIGYKDYVYVFGGGHIGQALTNILKTMNYYVSVIDDRKEIYDAFTGADEKHMKSFAEFIEEFGIKDNSVIVICSPSHQYDYNVIDQVIEKKIDYKYMGMLCSPGKLMKMLDITFEKHGKNINLKNFYSPIGLDTGGGSPEEIAISISAEILSLGNSKPNHNHLRASLKNDKYHYWKN